MISLWLDTGNASWRALVLALNSPQVDKTELAKEIAREKCTWELGMLHHTMKHACAGFMHMSNVMMLPLISTCILLNE